MHGDTIYFRNASGTRVIDAVRFGPQRNGSSSGRHPDGTPGFSELAAVSPGNPNGLPRNQDIVINEIMFNPISGDDDDEYVELHNRSGSPVDVGHWQLVDGISFLIPSGTVVEAGGYLVIAKNATNLVAKYPQLDGGNTVGNFGGRLSDRGERVALAQPDDPALPYNDLVVVDEVSYCDGWGKWADGGGSSLELVDPRSDNRFRGNWAGSDETRKAPWTTFQNTGVLDNGNGAITELHIYYEQAGECLVDDIEVSTLGMGVNVSDDFESGAGRWDVVRGNHIQSTLEAGEGCLSAQSFHIRASDKGDTKFSTGHGIWEDVHNRATIEMDSAPGAGQTSTMAAKARWLGGWPYLVIGLEGSYLEAGGRFEIPPNLGTPGASNSCMRVNGGPAIWDVGHSPVLRRLVRRWGFSAGRTIPTG